MSKVEVKQAGSKGRGVFAAKPIKKGEVIEVAHYIEIPETEYKKLKDTVIGYYWYEVEGNKTAIGLGSASLYNHSSQKPNAEFYVDAEKKVIVVTAIRDIKPGKEILFDYGYDGAEISVTKHKSKKKK